MFETFAHTADIGLRVRAATLEDLFCDAATGLFALIVTNLEQVEPREEVKLAIAGRRDECDYLLFDWLNELLFTFDSRRLVCSRFAVQFSADGLQTSAWGERLDASRHRLDHEVKAITYHGLRVTSEAGDWLAEVIIDI